VFLYKIISKKTGYNDVVCITVSELYLIIRTTLFHPYTCNKFINRSNKIQTILLFSGDSVSKIGFKYNRSCSVSTFRTPAIFVRNKRFSVKNLFLSLFYVHI